MGVGDFTQPGQGLPPQRILSPAYLQAAEQAGLQYPLPRPQGGVWPGYGGVNSKLPVWMQAVQQGVPPEQLALGAGPQRLALPPGQQAIPLGPAQPTPKAPKTPKGIGGAATGSRTMPANGTLFMNPAGQATSKPQGGSGMNARQFNFQPQNAEALFDDAGNRTAFNPSQRTTLPQPASQIIANADDPFNAMTGLPGGASSLDDIASASAAGAPSSIGQAATSAAAGSADDIAAAGMRGRMGGWMGKGGPVRQFGMGAVTGLLGGMGLNTAGGMVAQQNPYLGETIQGGGQGATYLGGLASMAPGVGAVGGMGAAAAGGAIAQGFTGSELGNQTVNAIRGSGGGPMFDTQKTADLWNQGDKMGAVGQALGDVTSPIWQGAANLFTGGEETNEDFLDVMGGIGGGEGASPEDAKAASLNQMQTMFAQAGTDPTTQAQLQKLYELQVTAGQDPTAAAENILLATMEDWQMRQAEQKSLGEMEAQRAQALKHMQPYVQGIRSQGAAEQQLLQALLPTLPAAYQGYGQFMANSAPVRANQYADSLMAQVSMAPNQAMQQRAMQQEQAFQNQLAQQLQAQQLQAAVEQFNQTGLSPSTPIQGL